METHPEAELSDDGKHLIVPNEGTWTVNNEGTITYRTELGRTIVTPTPIAYTVADSEGNRLERGTMIIVNQRVVADAIDTNTTEACEAYEDNVSIYGKGIIILVILIGSLLGVFLFRKEDL